MNQRIWPPESPESSESLEPSSPSPDTRQAASAGPLTLQEKVLNAMRQVYDPEIPINIVDLGLIYDTAITPSAEPSPFGSAQGVSPAGSAVDVRVTMTLTTPNCPEAESIPVRVKQVIEKIPQVVQAQVDIVWDPPWDRSMMSDDARLLLGLD